MRVPPLLPLFLLSAGVSARVLEVRDDAGIDAAISTLNAGDTLKIAPGEYRSRHPVTGIANLTVEGLDPENPPLFKGGSEAWHFSRCPSLTLRNLACSGQSENGINIDDGGEMTRPVEGVLLENVSVSDTGPDGNFDAIKCSGLDRLTIRSCSISGWGGQAIDLVGCHDVLIQSCKITGKPGFSQHTGPQFKGGCRHVILEKCTFKDAGPRPIHVGGSTGLDFFRPHDAPCEAADIVIRGNRIEGGECACAFTGVDGAEFTGNTIVYPTKWIFRILQENTAERFKRCGNVKISGNTITFRRAEIGKEVNVGENTAVSTFRFDHNHWLAEDQPEKSQPSLPVEETEGIYGKQ